MFSAGTDGAWSQAASHAWEAENGAASDAVRPITTKKELALRKKNERAHTTKLLARLEFLAPSLDESKGQPVGMRSKALRGRAKEELLKDVIDLVRLKAPGLRSEDIVLEESE
jgi:hypothetical protein